MACRRQVLVIMRECHGGDGGFVSPEPDPFFALAPGIVRGGLDPFFQELVDVPELGRIIHRRRGQSLAVGREGDASDPVPDLPPSCTNLLTRREFPHPQRGSDGPGSPPPAPSGVRVGVAFGVATFRHVRGVSWGPDGSVFPSGGKARARIILAWPRSRASSCPEPQSQNRTAPS